MIRDCKLYSITEIPNSVKQKYQELNNFKLFQNVGTNYNCACLYAIIHFFMNHKMETQLRKLISIKYNTKFSQQLVKLVKSNNGIRNFFDELYLIDYRAQNGETFLKEICTAEGLTSQNGTIYIDKLASYFGLQIVIFPGPKMYGNGLQKVHLLLDASQFYYLIPSQVIAIPQNKNENQESSSARGQCCRCQKLTREYFTPPYCKHHICLICLEKNILPTGNYYCPMNQRCQVVLKKVIQQFYAELQCKKEFEIRQLEDKKKVEYPKASKTEKSFEQQQLNSKIVETCLKCHKEQPYQLFKVEGCGHKFCAQCTDQYIRQSGSRDQFFCMLKDCCKKFIRSEFQEYLSRLQEKSKGQIIQIQECSICKQIIALKDQFINNCSHSICNKCIGTLKYIPKYCSNYMCSALINQKEFQDYQVNMVLRCDGCQTEHLQQNLYKNSICNHQSCFNCIKKRMRNQYIPCVDSCSRLCIGESFQEFFENQQIRQVQESELEIKLQEELKKQKELEEQQQKPKQIQREESQSSHTTSKSQNLSEHMVDSSRNSKLIKAHSVQSLLPEDYQSKNKKETLNSVEIKQNSVKQLSVIQDEGETEKQQQQEKQKPENQPESKPTHQLQEDDIENNEQIQEILFLNGQIQQEEDQLQLTQGECTMCFTSFSQFNLKQQLECKKHQIGVCCIKNFKACPQCEKKPGNGAIRVKEKLMLQKFKMQQEFLQEESQIIGSKYSENNYFDQQPPLEKYQQSPSTTDKCYQIQKENYNNLPLPTGYQIEKPTSIYDRLGTRFQSGVGRHQSMDPRQISRYPITTSTYQPQRFTQVRTYY